MSLPYPDIEPILFQLGPVAIRWYSCAYIIGLLGGWWQVKAYAKRTAVLSQVEVDDFLTWNVLGVVLGGRLGYVLFYNFPYYISNPLQALQVWKGGMSFHGGLLGVFIAVIIFTRIKKRSLLALGDMIACAVPIGLFLGRLANFINGELFGRVAYDVPWSFVFPNGGNLPRHPSQIYEALLEGLLMYIILNLLWRVKTIRERKGFLAGLFFFNYAVFRSIVEMYRQPDVQIGYLWDGFTMGQLLCVPMAVFGLFLMIFSRRGAFKRTDETLLEISNVRHGFFTRKGGVSKGVYSSLNCGLSSKDEPENVKENLKRACKELNCSVENLVLLNQCHSNKVVTVKEVWGVDKRPAADALVANRKGVVLGIVTADCFPVLLVDAEKGVIGAAHAGWKGALNGILENTIKSMYKLGAENIVAVVGSGIAKESYEVDASFPEAFIKKDKTNKRFFTPKNNEHFMFDLSGFVIHRLEKAGIEQITASLHDTCADEKQFFSYRRATLNKEKDYARQLSAICLV